MNKEPNKFERVKPVVVPHKTSSKFYWSSEWKECRDSFMEGRELCCSNCGFDEETREQFKNGGPYRLKKKGQQLFGTYVGMDSWKWIESKWNVDHILPVRRYWKYRLNPKNLRIFCSICNKNKGNDTWEYVPVEFLEKLNESQPKCSSVKTNLVSLVRKK